MSLAARLKTITEKMSQAEKLAEKQLKNVYKTTEAFRARQIKSAQEIFKTAKKLREGNLAKQANRVRRDIESRAHDSLETMLEKLNLPTKKEMDRLRKQVSHLQKRLDDLENPRGAK